MNQSFIEGLVPSYFKHALVQPLLKKPSLDPSVVNNYRPILKLPFLVKVVEKVVLNQLSAFLNEKCMINFNMALGLGTALKLPFLK